VYKVLALPEVREKKDTQKNAYYIQLVLNSRLLAQKSLRLPYGNVTEY
jgi:hypothetical protein